MTLENIYNLFLIDVSLATEDISRYPKTFIIDLCYEVEKSNLPEDFKEWTIAIRMSI